MARQPFTPAGVTAKTAELYALSNSLLFAQADLVEADFRAWLNVNFTLSAAQVTILAGMNDHGIKYFAAQCSMAFRGRLPVTLIWPTPTPGYTKVPLSYSTLRVATLDTGVLEVSGALTFEMEYRP